jgi:hypothetical protein
VGGVIVGALALACFTTGAVTTTYWRRVRRYAQTGKAS